jgi:hypothetical protein
VLLLSAGSCASCLQHGLSMPRRTRCFHLTTLPRKQYRMPQRGCCQEHRGTSSFPPQCFIPDISRLYPTLNPLWNLHLFSLTPASCLPETWEALYWHLCLYACLGGNSIESVPHVNLHKGVVKASLYNAGGKSVLITGLFQCYMEPVCYVSRGKTGWRGTGKRDYRHRPRTGCV